MDHQTKISEQNGSRVTASTALARDVGKFADDVLTLAELQAQLLVADVQQCGQRVLVPGLTLLCGIALGLACFPIAMAAFALLLIQIFDTSYAAAFLLAVVAGAGLSSLLCFIGWIQFRKHLTVLRRSQQEFVRNLRWIRKVLERSRITRRNSIDNPWRTVT